jgi:hypothetical protein
MLCDEGELSKMGDGSITELSSMYLRSAPLSPTRISYIRVCQPFILTCRLHGISFDIIGLSETGGLFGTAQEVV